MKYSIVKYKGHFGYIKPWTAVRDSETFTQQFLSQSMVEGIEKKLFPELLSKKGINAIARHKIQYRLIDVQQERTWSKGGFNAKKEGNLWKTNLGILVRGVMVYPTLYLAFVNSDFADKAMTQTICLARNEDLMFPIETFEMSEDEFDEISGFELRFDKGDGFKVGYNRFSNSEPMYGNLEVTGNPLGDNEDETF